MKNIYAMLAKLYIQICASIVIIHILHILRNNTEDYGAYINVKYNVIIVPTYTKHSADLPINSASHFCAENIVNKY